MKKVPFLSIILTIALVQCNILPALALDNADTASTEDAPAKAASKTTEEVTEETISGTAGKPATETVGGGVIQAVLQQ